MSRGRLSWKPTLAWFLGSAATWAILLVVLLARANPGRLALASGLELLTGTFAICLITHVAFSAVLLLLWPLARRLAQRRLADAWPAYYALGLLALNVIWVLWNRLSMTHQWASVRPFTTWTGIFQNLLLALVFVAALLAAGSLASGRRALAAGWLVLAAVIVAGGYRWTRSEEIRYRTYDLAGLTAAGARAERASADAPPPRSTPRVILLGIDGLCWSVLVPLIADGQLPTFERLARGGAVGYLDNGDESLSPAVWTTIFSGRGVRDHRVQDYKKVVLPRTGTRLPDALLMKPSTDSFYGLTYLLHYLEPLGLWRQDWVSTGDRATPAIWEIVSQFEGKVVVLNPLVNLPVHAVNGVMAILNMRPSREPLTMYPPELLEVWQPEEVDDLSGRTEESFRGLQRENAKEIGFTIDLLRTFGPDLAVYYTHFVDSVTHTNWDFWARGDFLLSGLPRDLDDEGWATLLRQNREDRLVRAYRAMDRSVGRLLEAYPDATFVIVSDHGWTFSGYEHFGSPDGVLVMSGPGVRPGVVQGARIEDVTPTVLAMLEMPLARELQGRVLDAALDPVPAPAFIKAYARTPHESLEGLAPVELQPEEIERLKALGYVQ